MAHVNLVIFQRFTYNTSHTKATVMVHNNTHDVSRLEKFTISSLTATVLQSGGIDRSWTTLAQPWHNPGTTLAQPWHCNDVPTMTNKYIYMCVTIMLKLHSYVHSKSYYQTSISIQLKICLCVNSTKA